MTRSEKAAERAQRREQRRRPRDEEPPRDEGSEHEVQEHDGRERDGRERQSRQAPKLQHGAAPSDVPEIASQARKVLLSLKGVDAESVSGLARTPQGWKVTLEVVELRRIPQSTDVLASYDVELDGQGRVLRVERGRRYHRAQAELEANR